MLQKTCSQKEAVPLITAAMFFRCLRSTQAKTQRKIIMLISCSLCEPKEDIEKWHAVYCQKLTELFDNYKGRNPDYKHKKLIIK